MASSQSTSATEQLGLPTLLALFLVPGAIMSVVFVVIAPFIETAGFPPIAALLVAILIVLVPFELGVILRAGRDAPQRIRSVIPYRRHEDQRIQSTRSPRRSIHTLTMIGPGLRTS